jgi:cellulose biosynthesis protein BcsQ
VRTIAIWSIKGGVGKTSASVNLAHAASTRGTRTLLWDLDPQGAASFYLRVLPRLGGGVRTVVNRATDLGWHACATEFANLSLLPADFSLRHLDLELNRQKKTHKLLARKLKPLSDRFDLVLIDCPPSISLVSEAVVCAVDAVLAPVIPSTLSLRTLEQLRAFVDSHGRRRISVLAFLSMVDRRKKMHNEITEKCLTGDGFLRTSIPSASVVERMGITRAPIGATLPSQPASKAFQALWGEIAARLAIEP